MISRKKWARIAGHEDHEGASGRHQGNKKTEAFIDVNDLKDAEDRPAGLKIEIVLTCDEAF